MYLRSLHVNIIWARGTITTRNTPDRALGNPWSLFPTRSLENDIYEYSFACICTYIHTVHFKCTYSVDLMLFRYAKVVGVLPGQGIIPVQCLIYTKNIPTLKNHNKPSAVFWKQVWTFMGLIVFPFYLVNIRIPSTGSFCVTTGSCKHLWPK